MGLEAPQKGPAHLALERTLPGQIKWKVNEMKVAFVLKNFYGQIMVYGNGKTGFMYTNGKYLAPLKSEPKWRH